MNKEINFPLYLVGGAVRDRVMGYAASDRDYTTPLTKAEIIEYCIANDLPYYVVNDAYGTVVLLVDGEMAEVTPFRVDKNCDGRHAEVEYTTDITEDLARRDFTINAMAIDYKTGELIDPFHGQDDIDSNLLVAVGDPLERFQEDYLRVLRGLRFATVYDLEIESTTWKSMKACALGMILNVSRERIAAEIDKLFAKARGSHLPRFFEMLDECGLLEHLFPLLKEIKVKLADKLPRIEYHPEGNTYQHLMDLLSHSTKSVDLRYAVLTHDLGKLVTAEQREDGTYSFHGHEKYTDLVDVFFAYLPASNKRKDYLKMVMQHHMKPLLASSTPKTVRRMMADIGVDGVEEVLEFSRLDAYRSAVSPKRFEKMFREVLEDVEKRGSVIKPLVDGRRIMHRYGVSGARVGEIKEIMYEIQLDDDLKTAEEVISKFEEVYQ